MMTRKTLLLGFCLLAMGSARAAALYVSPHLGIQILQSGQRLALQVQNDGVVQVTLAGKPFEISYPKGILDICASMNKAIYKKAKVGTDTLRDFNSCMLLYKSEAMGPHANYLPLSSGNNFALDTAHGAQTLSDKRAVYHVVSLSPPGKGVASVPLADVHRTLYLILWMDHNRNKVIDPGELERWKFRFQ